MSDDQAYDPYRDDYEDDDSGESLSKYEILQRVASYWHVCKKVRDSSTGSLFFGGLMLTLWYMAFFGGPKQFSVLSFAYLILGLMEFCNGLVSRFYPSAEGEFFSGFTLMLFGLASFLRQFIEWMNGVKPNIFFLLFAGWILYNGWSKIQGYFILRKLFSVRPTAEHVRWMNDLLKELKQSNPEIDNDTLSLLTSPRMKVKLLDDIALIYTPSDDMVAVCPRSHFFISLVDEDPKQLAKRKSGLPLTELYIGGQNLGEFELDPDNWRNYIQWKEQEDDDPPVAHPVT